MADQPDTTQDQNSQTTENPSAPKDASPAPASPDTNSSTTELKPAAETPPADEGSLLNPKPESEEEQSGDEGEPDPTAAFYGAPEGDYEITGLPEDVTIDADALAAIAPTARELNLSSEGLSKIANVYAEKVLPGVATQIADQINADVVAMRAAWATDARALVQGGLNAAGETVEADPALGGKTLKEVQQISAKAIDRFGGEDFREFLDTNGLGNHPKMLRFAALAGMAISEDTELLRTNGAPEPAMTREQKFYGKKT